MSKSLFYNAVRSAVKGNNKNTVQSLNANSKILSEALTVGDKENSSLSARIASFFKRGRAIKPKREIFKPEEYKPRPEDYQRKANNDEYLTTSRQTGSEVVNALPKDGELEAQEAIILQPEKKPAKLSRKKQNKNLSIFAKNLRRNKRFFNHEELFKDFSQDDVQKLFEHFRVNDYFGNKKLQVQLENLTGLIHEINSEQISNQEKEIELQQQLLTQIKELNCENINLRFAIDKAREENVNNLGKLIETMESKASDKLDSLATQMGGLFTVLGFGLTAIALWYDKKAKVDEAQEKQNYKSADLKILKDDCDSRIVELEKLQEKLSMKKLKLENQLNSEQNKCLNRLFKTDTSTKLAKVDDEISKIDLELNNKVRERETLEKKIAIRRP